MDDTLQTIAVINKSAILKKLRNINIEKSNQVIVSQTEIDRNKNAIAESVCWIIEALTKIYYLVIIPKAVVDEIIDAATESTHLIFKRILSTYNIIISDEPCDDIFDFAHNVYEEFKCSVDIIPYDIVLIKGEE